MTTVVTKDAGGRTKLVGVLYLEPDQVVTEAAAPVALADAGIDPGFTMDLLSACLAHARCGVHLYRSVAGRTANDQLRLQYEAFGEDLLDHVRILEELVEGMGGDPRYVSPSARATQATATALLESTFLCTGSIDLATSELAMLDAVVLTEAKGWANWQTLSELAQAITDDELREHLLAAATQVLGEEDEHYGWVSETRASMLYMLATGQARPAAPPDDVIIDLTEQVGAVS